MSQEDKIDEIYSECVEGDELLQNEEISSSELPDSAEVNALSDKTLEEKETKNGVPTHDTIQRVMGMIRPESLQQLPLKWQELLDSNEGEKFKKIICIDGKTMRSNKRKDSKPCHIVSAWSREDGFCLGQKGVEEKSNEIPAIPKVLETLEIKGQVVTIDAMGTY